MTFIEFFKALKSWNAGGLQYPIDEAYQNLEKAWNAGYKAGYEDGLNDREGWEEIL